MTYKTGIIKAIEELKDRSGSSMASIKKHMQANLPADKKWMNTMFLSSLKSGVKSGDLVQVKNSFKLSADYKKVMIRLRLRGRVLIVTYIYIVLIVFSFNVIHS